jgi:hypothetical protein
VLSKGYYASLLAYTETANRIFLGNPEVSTYSATQREAYLNSTFFTETVKLLDYLQLHLLWMETQNAKNIALISDRYISAVTVASLIVILLLPIAFLIFGPLFEQGLRKDSGIVSSCCRLLSYKTVAEE